MRMYIDDEGRCVLDGQGQRCEVSPGPCDSASQMLDRFILMKDFELRIDRNDERNRSMDTRNPHANEPPINDLGTMDYPEPTSTPAIDTAGAVRDSLKLMLATVQDFADVLDSQMVASRAFVKCYDQVQEIDRRLKAIETSRETERIVRMDIQRHDAERA